MEIIHLPHLISHSEGLQIQDDHVNSILAKEKGNALYLLQHEPIYTIGRTRDVSSLKDPNSLPFPATETNRGGQATYHGPGQLVGYPILDLSVRNKDLHHHLRLIEEALILTTASYGIQATRRDGFTGVWVENRKLASIGVGVRKWVSMHGFAINVTPECLPPFSAITPCGLGGVQMTCVALEANTEVTVDHFAATAATIFKQIFA
jgi:lipoyl(octanoyl) transferase